MCRCNVFMHLNEQVQIRILIADDHPVLRRGLRQVIENEPGFSVVAEAGTGASALRFVETLSPDFAVVDLEMPGMGGLELIRTVHQMRFKLAMAVLTMHADETNFNAAFDSGTQGYVLKDGAFTEIIACIRAVIAGEQYVTPVLSQFLLNRYRRETVLRCPSPGVADLTPVQRRVLQLISECRTSRQIAASLRRDERTVEGYRADMCAKLGLNGSHSLVKFALQHRHEL